MTSDRQQRSFFLFFSFWTSVLSLSCVNVCVRVLLFYVLFSTLFSHSVILFLLLLLWFVMVSSSYSLLCLSSSTSFILQFTFGPYLLLLFPFFIIYTTLCEKEVEFSSSRYLFELSKISVQLIRGTKPWEVKIILAFLFNDTLGKYLLRRNRIFINEYCLNSFYAKLEGRNRDTSHWIMEISDRSNDCILSVYLQVKHFDSNMWNWMNDGISVVVCSFSQ